MILKSSRVKTKPAKIKDEITNRVPFFTQRKARKDRTIIRKESAASVPLNVTLKIFG